MGVFQRCTLSLSRGGRAGTVVLAVWAQWCWPCGHSGVGRVGTVVLAVLAVWAQWCWPCGHSGVGRVAQWCWPCCQPEYQRFFIHSFTHISHPHTHTHPHSHTFIHKRPLSHRCIYTPLQSQEPNRNGHKDTGKPKLFEMYVIFG